MRVLTKADFTGERPATVVPIDIRDEGTAYIRVMSGTRRELYLDVVRAMVGTVDEQVSASAHIVAASLCDENGALFFPDYPKDVTRDELVKIGDSPWYWLSAIVEQAGILNGFSEAGKAAAKKEPAMTKSSSSTVSPVTSGERGANSSPA